jgi:hypothetical protein
MYLKGNGFTVSDIIRSRINGNEEIIQKIFKLIQILEFGEVDVTLSASNRNIGKELFTLTKFHVENILSTAQGSARFNLFRLNKEMMKS